MNQASFTPLDKASIPTAPVPAKTSKKDNYKDENGFIRYNDLGDFGIKFDANGEITNYESIMKSYDNKIAAKEAKWNGMSAKEQSKNKKLENEIAALTANRDTLKSLIISINKRFYKYFIFDYDAYFRNPIQREYASTNCLTGEAVYFTDKGADKYYLMEIGSIFG